MAMHRSAIDVQRRGCSALYYAASGDVECCHAIIAAGWQTAITEAIEAHPEDTDVLQRGQATLRILESVSGGSSGWCCGGLLCGSRDSQPSPAPPAASVPEASRSSDRAPPANSRMSRMSRVQEKEVEDDQSQMEAQEDEENEAVKAKHRSEAADQASALELAWQKAEQEATARRRKQSLEEQQSPEPQGKHTRGRIGGESSPDSFVDGIVEFSRRLLASPASVFSNTDSSFSKPSTIAEAPDSVEAKGGDATKQVV
jgi:hypothetical protein